MAKIRPFKGLLYNPHIIDDLSRVVTPPYDVISEKMQDEFYRLHRDNVVRLILGKVKRSDNKSDNRYTRARRFFQDWLRKGILIQDKESSFYIYQQDYPFKGKIKSRLGFISLMKIEDPHKSCVLPHEYTFDKPRLDRFNLIKATKANLCPIFALFEDRGYSIMDILKKSITKDPLIDVEQDGVTHKLWRLSKKRTIERISGLMEDKQVFIADGHHRYEVALNFRDWMRRKDKRALKLRDCDYVMVYLSNLDPEALTILSTHRVIRSIKYIDYEKSVSKLKEYFYVDRFRDKDNLLSRMEKAKEGEFIFGIYYKNRGFISLTLRDREALYDILPRYKSYQWRYLDVTILHQLIFDHILNVKEKVAKRENIVYTRDADYAVRLVDEENYKMAFFLNPPRLEQVMDVARSRDRMPHKSTFFYPKPLSGLVFYKMKGV